MSGDQTEPGPKVACDAMCGGLARWLRVLGVDAFYEPAIDDAELVAVGLRERRVVISSDHRLFERGVFARGELRGLHLPVGLRLAQQVRFATAALGVRPGQPRCTRCNGTLLAIPRADVGDQVPARTLIWRREFFRCGQCGHVFWEGTHWRRIGKVREAATDGTAAQQNAAGRRPA
ncbi:MAG: hypothetical protein HRF50_03175 [Phycisphaerae bacterium]|jgi:hypothetical protein